jgi:tricorn protease-like protein
MEGIVNATGLFIRAGSIIGMVAPLSASAQTVFHIQPFHSTELMGNGHMDGRLMRFPDISQDRVVFAYAGHLWIAPRSGGLARRLTMREGTESFPKFSRDGKLVAFTANYDGNSSVYLVSTDGGTPRRLTFAPTKDGDQVLGWSLDGRRVLFASTKYGEPPESAQLFLVSPQGEMPEALPLPRATLASFSPDGPDGGRIAYLPTSLENQNWRHSTRTTEPHFLESFHLSLLLSNRLDGIVMTDDKKDQAGNCSHGR